MFERSYVIDNVSVATSTPLRARYEISVPIACTWGRRSYFVACRGRTSCQATKNDGLPHACYIPMHSFHDEPLAHSATMALGLSWGGVCFRRGCHCASRSVAI